MASNRASWAAARCAYSGPVRARYFSATTWPHRSPRNVDSLNKLVSLDIFRQVAFHAERPLQFRAHSKSLVKPITAQTKWFRSTLNEKGQPSPAGFCGEFAPFIKDLPSMGLPIEIATPDQTSVDALQRFRKWLSLQKLDEYDMYQSLLEITAPAEPGGFNQMFAPVGMLLAALEHNRDLKPVSQPVQMYIAQCSIEELDEPLRGDIETPELVMTAGKGDVYNTSIWLGTEPTFTPLHKDPNPNLFYQLHNRKSVRLLPPNTGLQMYGKVQRKLGRAGNPKIRQEEMMSGEERILLHDAVWTSASDDMTEANLGPGDCLFIPKGWWHSVKSQGDRGALNGSVNWWFR